MARSRVLKLFMHENVAFLLRCAVPGACVKGTTAWSLRPLWRVFDIEGETLLVKIKWLRCGLYYCQLCHTHTPVTPHGVCERARPRLTAPSTWRSMYNTMFLGLLFAVGHHGSIDAMPSGRAGRRTPTHHQRAQNERGASSQHTSPHDLSASWSG